MKITKHTWPVLIVSKQLELQNDEGLHLRNMVDNLETEQGCSVLRSYSNKDAIEVFSSHADIGAIVIDYNAYTEENTTPTTAVLDEVRKRNKTIPVFLLVDRKEMEGLSTRVFGQINECLWKTSSTTEFLAGRIETQLVNYARSLYPKFFGEMVKYSSEYKYAWHTPGHMGGEGFLQTPSGIAMHRFYGENVFRADLSISVPELGSLLDHEGVVGDAEKNSARVFGADQTYYVLNGTSNVNQIIWRSQLVRDDIAFVDRNCHKSLNYAMVITDAYPIYMVPRRNKRGIIGPCHLSEFSEASIKSKIKDSTLIPEVLKTNYPKMSALTNSTYDGVCYNVINIKKQLQKSVENLHFDEAWYAYARFHSMYKDHYGMTDDDLNSNHPPIFCSHSTHKLLTAFSQASMLHVRDGSEVKIDPDELNESYMMHGSTSPQYSMIASLDVATKIMDDSGEMLMTETIRKAISLRKKISEICQEMESDGQWFFDMWQPKSVEYEGSTVPFTEVPTEFLAENQYPWVFTSKDNWHGFADMEDDYAMLDPIKLTFTTPGINEKGEMQEEGIPAAIVTNYLINHDIVCEKTDYYSFLLLNSMGITRAKQASLISALLKFKELYDANTPLSQVQPDLVKKYPEIYENTGVKDHCNSIHSYYKKHNILDKMQEAFQVIPDQGMKPSEAYHCVVRKNVEYVELENMKGRMPAVMIVPYPPGIPIMMGGEVLDDKATPIFNYLQARQDFENLFPGYTSDIHGVRRVDRDGKKYFEIMCIKEQ